MGEHDPYRSDQLHGGEDAAPVELELDSASQRASATERSGVSLGRSAYDGGVPYSLKGNSVVKSDSGQVVKTHPTREKALAHLRALKANVEESSPAVLGLLLEGFDDAKHPRGPLGRWIATFSHSVHGTTTTPIEAHSAAEAQEKALAHGRQNSAGRVHLTLQGVAPHDARARELSRHPVSTPGLPPDAQRLMQARARIHQEELKRASAEIKVRPVGVGDLARPQVTGAQRAAAKGRAGRRAQQRIDALQPQHGAAVPGAAGHRELHAALTRRLSSLPVGRFHSEAATGGHVRRTAQGFEVYGHSDAKPRAMHKTPSAAAGHLLRLARGVRESEERPEVLGALLEGAGLREATLTAKKRAKLPKKAFAIPESESYPIHDEAHARNALSRVAQYGSPEEKKRVRAAVKRRYPHIGGG